MIKHCCQHITLNEAVELTQHQSMRDIAFALDLYDTFNQRRGNYDTALSIGAVFRAGYIAGVRTERMKSRVSERRNSQKEEIDYRAP